MPPRFVERGEVRMCEIVMRGAARFVGPYHTRSLKQFRRRKESLSACNGARPVQASKS